MSRLPRMPLTPTCDRVAQHSPLFVVASCTWQQQSSVHARSLQESRLYHSKCDLLFSVLTVRVLELGKEAL